MIREFSPDLVLEESQILSYFSKLSSEKKRKNPNIKSVEPPTKKNKK
jgi:hypothetical protein